MNSELHVMDIPEIKEWESPTGWCRRLAQLYCMNETQTAVLEEVRRRAYIQGVNDILDRGRCGISADGTA